jgi:hypothetical protein
LNYRFLGPLAAALPNAKIIVLRRDPRDVAVSCYRNMFNFKTNEYSNDLAYLAEFCLGFDQTINFWRARLPDRFLEVDYTELTNDPETQTKRLFDHCDLTWSPDVLIPSRNENQVRTLSIVQAR